MSRFIVKSTNLKKPKRPTIWDGGIYIPSLAYHAHIVWWERAPLFKVDRHKILCKSKIYISKNHLCMLGILIKFHNIFINWTSISYNKHETVGRVGLCRIYHIYSMHARWYTLVHNMKEESILLNFM